MKICIYGAGVIGGILGSSLARAGHDVSLIARGAHLAAIREAGLTMVTPDHRYTIPFKASDDPRDLGPQDLVIVAAKTSALDAVAKTISPLLGPDTLVAFAQNGVFWFYGDGFAPGGKTLDLSRLDPDGALHRVIGAERALGLVCFAGGEIHTPGVIDATRTGGQFHAGAVHAATQARAKDIIAGLGSKDVKVDWTDDIRLWMWRKHASVVSNQVVCSLTGATIGQNQTNPRVYEVILRVIAEACSIASAHGIDVGFNMEERRRSPMTSPHKPSMLQDIERGRPIEIESQYLALLDLARQAGIDTPVLDTLVPLLEMRARVAGSLQPPPGA